MPVKKFDLVFFRFWINPPQQILLLHLPLFSASLSLTPTIWMSSLTKNLTWWFHINTKRQTSQDWALRDSIRTMERGRIKTALNCSVAFSQPWNRQKNEMSKLTKKHLFLQKLNHSHSFLSPLLPSSQVRCRREQKIPINPLGQEPDGDEVRLNCSQCVCKLHDCCVLTSSPPW